MVSSYQSFTDDLLTCRFVPFLFGNARGGGTPLYKPYRYVPPYRVGFLGRFGLKTSTHFAHFGQESGMVFKELWECMNVFVVSIPNELKKEREICEFEMD